MCTEYGDIANTPDMCKKLFLHVQVAERIYIWFIYETK